MTLYERIGGKLAVNAAVDRFYDLMLSDDRVKHYFSNVNMDKQRLHQKSFITYALGGADPYPGRSLRDAHQKLVDEKGLSDEHFDATIENLATALKDLKVPEDLIAEAGNALESMRNDILCR